jgi:hypothetical protein
MKRILVPAALALTLVLAGCTAGGSSASDSQAGSAAEPAQVAPETGTDTAAGDSAEDRQVITNGYVTLTADDPIAAAADAVALVEAAGGRVDARSETAPSDGDQGAASLTLRIPSAVLTETLEKLKELGVDDEVSLTDNDVTTQSQDLDARIGALRASVDRLTALLATATDTDVLIKLESAISERQGDLESMQAQQRSLADQVSLATLQLQLVSPADAPGKTPDTFLTGLETGWNAFTGFLGFVLVALGVLLPWVVAAGVLAFVVVTVIRRRRRHPAPADAA